MDFFLNKTEIEKNDISLSFKKITSFDELLDCHLDEVIYIENDNDEYSKMGIKNQIIKKKKKLFSKAIFFQLNNIALEPTQVNRDNFNSCGYILYKMEVKLKHIGESK